MKHTLLFAELARRGVTLEFNDEGLMCRARDGAMTPDLLAAIEKLKPAIVDLLKRRAVMPKRESVTRLGDDDEIPLSFNQQRLWFLDQLNSKQCGYVMIRGYRVNGPINSSIVEQAIQGVVSRHRILTTQIRIENEVPLQVVTESPSIHVHTAQIEGVSDDEWAIEIERWAGKVGRQPFDIAEEPLIRAYLLSRTESDHALLLTMHHIAADDWSWTIFMDEFATCYAAFSQGTEPALSALPISYADYAAHQRASLESEKVQRQVEYWKQKLGGTLPTLNFPLDNPRPQQQTDSGARANFAISLHDRESLKRLAVREGATLFMALMAVFKILLHRYTSQEDIIVGTPIANRNLVEISPLIGFFANTLIIRSSVQGDKSFLELLRDVRTSCLEAYENQDVPFEHIVEVINPPRVVSRPPIFDVQFALRNVPRKKINIPGLQLEEIDLDPRTSKFDLFFFLREEGDQLSVSIEYNTDLFLNTTIERIGRAYLQLVENVVDFATRPIAQIPMLREADRQLQLKTWNDTARNYSLDMTLHGLIEQQASATPDAIAVQFGDGRLTYGELDARAEALAVRLIGNGISVGDFVGVLMDRSEHLVVALLGVLKTGAAYVPLDPHYPEDRIAFILESAGVAALVTDDSQRSSAEELHSKVVNCGEDLDSSAAARLQLDGIPSLAYVIYTSGSTGKPKGVAVTHRNVVNFLNSMAETPGIEKNDTLLAVTTLSFDISILELFLPLFQGATVYVATRDDAMDASALAQIIDTHGVTVMQATPATWEMLLAGGWSGSSRLKALCGGEAFPRQLADNLLGLVSEVWNMYGPTETTIWSSIAKVEPSERPVPIGSPIANTALHVLDRNLEPVPIGAVGELHIGGAGVAFGYLNQEELTNERFVPDPFDDDPEARLYKTGDLARYRENGILECLGRIDNQVKIRGFRIELEEIEAALQAHEQVAQVVVTAAQSSRKDGFDSLVAHYVLNESRAVTHTKLRAHLRASLPEYMIPQHYNEHDQFPLTPNNKVDRKALSQYRPPSQHVDVLPPKTDSECYLAQVWRDILDVDQVGRYDFFFEIGGHSLLAAQMVARVENESGTRIPLRSAILSNLSEMATHLDSEKIQPEKPGIVKRLLDRIL